MKQPKMTLKRKDALIGTAFMAPWIIGLLAFTLFPLVYSIWLSLCQVEFSVNGIITEFVGVKWYKEALTADANFIKNIVSDLQAIVFSTPMIIVMSIVLALLLNHSITGRAFFRALYFFPVIIISGPVMSKLMSNQATTIIHPESYSIYQVLEALPGVLSVPLLYIFDNIVIILWYAGVQTLIILSDFKRLVIRFMKRHPSMVPVRGRSFGRLHCLSFVLPFWWRPRIRLLTWQDLRQGQCIP